MLERSSTRSPPSPRVKRLARLYAIPIVLVACGTGSLLALLFVPAESAVVEIAPSEFVINNGIGGRSYDVLIAVANRSSATISVDRLVASCGCISAVASHRSFGPSERINVYLSIQRRTNRPFYGVVKLAMRTTDDAIPFTVDIQVRYNMLSDVSALVH